MKKIQLKHLRIENFKGIKKLELDMNSDVINIFGRNAAGKTSIFDAWEWILFNKDSSGTEKFNIRPLDADGNTIDNVEILVEAVLDVDGKEETLQKVQKQSWVKKRGTDVITLQGNVNTYEINSFPASEKEFKNHIAGIISEDLFKLLTDPRAFANLPWKKQREILMRFISEVTDADVLATDSSKYGPVAEEVLAAPVEKCIEKAKKAMSKLKDRQKELPSRIDEASKSLAEVPELSELELQRNALNEQLTEVQKQRDDASESYKIVSDLQAEIMQTQLDIGGVQQKANATLDAERRDARRLHDELESKSYDLFNLRKRKEAEVSRLQAEVENLEKERSDEMKKWIGWKGREMSISATICETCGQVLPNDKIEKITADFEMNKKAQMEEIEKRGNDIKSSINSCNEKIYELNAEISTLKTQWNKTVSEETKAYEAINAIPASADISGNQEYQALQLKLSNLQNQLSGMDTGESFKQQLNIRERGIREELDAVNKQFAAVDANERIKKRIEELKIEQKDIAQKVANQEQKIFLLEEFSRAKMDLLSSKINSQFQSVTVKLFEEQYNGGKIDTCKIQINGVDYKDLNSAGKIQAGIDVIHSLSRLYGTSVPVWLDNRESVSEIPEVDCQIINLFVSAADKVLRVEVA